MDSSCICYNLIDAGITDIPLLPEAYIVEVTETKQLGYIQKQATEDTLSSMGLEYVNTPHEQLLEICTQLKPNALKKRFQTSSRKQLSFADIVRSSKKKEVVLTYIHRKLATFFTLIHTHQYPISQGIARKDRVQDHVFEFGTDALHPILEFTKIPEGIEYAFSLKNKEKQLIPNRHTIEILLNEPAWISIDKKIYPIQHLNANKLKPFRNKEKITIAKKHMKTYVEKVIIPVIKHIDVIANGFDIITYTDCNSKSIEVVQDFIHNIYVAKVIFGYQDVSFEYHSSKTTSSSVAFEEDDTIKIVQIKRNPEKEKEAIDALQAIGLHLNHNLMLETKESTESQVSKDPYAIIEWIGSNRTALEIQGFAIKLPIVEGKNIANVPHGISIKNKKEKDWFDIKGVVTIGEEEIPFSRFIPYIKQNNRLFPLNDQEFFIIPLPWMSRYKKLSRFGEMTKNGVRVNKNNYTILKEMLPTEEIALEINQQTTYEASPLLKATLRPYQEQGIQWLVQHYNNGLGACLADDMGLGKTLQTIATLVFAKEQLTPESTAVKKIQFDLFDEPLSVKTFLKALIVLPSSLIFNWAQEIIKFAPHLTITKYVGADRKKVAPYLETYDIILTTYTILSNDIERLKKTNFTYLILDESQQIKNKNSKIFQAINTVNTTHKISLSGTPLENSLSDLWSQMHFINPGILGSFPFFKEYFKSPIERHQNQERLLELKELITPFILRRTKEQVAKDLPALSEQVVYTEMLPEQKKQYESEKSIARNILLGVDATSTNKIHIMNTLTKLRQLANHPQLMDSSSQHTSGKFTQVTNYLDTLVRSNKKVLIFSSFVSHLAIYQDWCRENNISFLSLTGQTKSADREHIVTEFQTNEDMALFFISLKAGGVGLNLTKASYVVILDPWWNPFIEKQAIARAHRIGQSQKVLVTRFITKNTIEEKILHLQDSKKKLSDDIIEVNSIPDFVETNLPDLLK